MNANADPPPPTGNARTRRLAGALAVFAAWLVVTVLGTTLASPGRKSLVDLVGSGPGWGFLAAGLLVLAAARLFGWKDLGLVRPLAGSGRLLLFPILYIVLFAILAARLGLPAPAVLGWLAVNTLLVAVSEELMFRGLLFRALLGRMAVWPAIAVTSLAFGAIHVINAFGTGETGAAFAQAIAASMSGVVLVAIVIRTGSLFPAILYHWLWNLGAFAVAASPSGGGGEGSVDAGATLTAILFVLPNFLYALFILRRAGRGERILRDP